MVVECMTREPGVLLETLDYLDDKVQSRSISVALTIALFGVMFDTYLTIRNTISNPFFAFLSFAVLSFIFVLGIAVLSIPNSVRWDRHLKRTFGTHVRNRVKLVSTLIVTVILIILGYFTLLLPRQYRNLGDTNHKFTRVVSLVSAVCCFISSILYLSTNIAVPRLSEGYRRLLTELLWRDACDSFWLSKVQIIQKAYTALIRAHNSVAHLSRSLATVKPLKSSMMHQSSPLIRSQSNTSLIRSNSQHSRVLSTVVGISSELTNVKPDTLDPSVNVTSMSIGVGGGGGHSSTSKLPIVPDDSAVFSSFNRNTTEDESSSSELTDFEQGSGGGLSTASLQKAAVQSKRTLPVSLAPKESNALSQYVRVEDEDEEESKQMVLKKNNDNDRSAHLIPHLDEAPPPIQAVYSAMTWRWDQTQDAFDRIAEFFWPDLTRPDKLPSVNVGAEIEGPNASSLSDDSRMQQQRRKKTTSSLMIEKERIKRLNKNALQIKYPARLFSALFYTLVCLSFLVYWNYTLVIPGLRNFARNLRKTYEQLETAEYVETAGNQRRRMLLSEEWMMEDDMNMEMSELSDKYDEQLLKDVMQSLLLKNRRRMQNNGNPQTTIVPIGPTMTTKYDKVTHVIIPFLKQLSSFCFAYADSLTFTTPIGLLAGLYASLILFRSYKARVIQFRLNKGSALNVSPKIYAHWRSARMMGTLASFTTTGALLICYCTALLISLFVWDYSVYLVKSHWQFLVGWMGYMLSYFIVMQRGIMGGILTDDMGRVKPEKRNTFAWVLLWCDFLALPFSTISGFLRIIWWLLVVPFSYLRLDISMYPKSMVSWDTGHCVFVSAVRLAVDRELAILAKETSMNVVNTDSVMDKPLL